MSFSVLMSVFFAENPDFLAEALQSLLDQTRPAAELILVEDGPLTPALYGVIEDYRIRLSIQTVRLEENSGLAAALNEGLKHCRYPLVARMDSDDVCLPERFEKQLAYMESNTHLSVSSSWIDEYDEGMKSLLYTRKVPGDPEGIHRRFRSRNPINHMAAIFKRQDVLQVGGYPVTIKKAQDYCLWARMKMEGCQFGNIQEVLVKVRTGDAFFERRGFEYLKNEYQVLKYHQEIGFIGWPLVLRNGLLRTGVRLSPRFVKKWLYAYIRQ